MSDVKQLEKMEFDSNIPEPTLLDVYYAYRILLKRNPETVDAVVHNFSNVKTIDDLVSNFENSKEYKTIRLGIQDNKRQGKRFFVYKKVEKYLLALDLNDRMISLPILRDCFCVFESELVKRIAPKNESAIDIGSNIGFYTILLASIVDQKSHVFAYECDLYHLPLLVESMEINNLQQRIKVNHSAVWGSKKKLYIHSSGGDNLGGTWVSDKNDSESSWVMSTTIDDEFENYSGKIGFIKIDVEGAEVQVLKGMQNTLARWNPNILIEMSQANIDNTDPGVVIMDAMSILKEAGYEIFSINGDKLFPVDVGASMNSSVGSKTVGDDYVAISRKRPESRKAIDSFVSTNKYKYKYK